jgi:predicted ATPase/DNA-binding XRE family transcriptional regulator
MNTTNTFGGWLRQRRKERGLTLDELADRISYSSITLVKIEAGERRPSRQVALSLAEEFDIPADEREAFTVFARTGGASPGTYSSLAEIDEVAARAPWRATHRHKTNLPSMLTPLIGRQQDERTVRDMLLQSRVRLLTLTGPPGIGKTRLSLQVAAGLVGHSQFEDGIYFIELAPISEPDLVLATVARTLGLEEMRSQSIEETLVNYVQQRRLLLVIDNFEQVLDAAPHVVKMLESSPWSKALVTSREALHVRGERRFPVSPLLLPDLNRLPPADALGGYSAVELFVERAQAVAPGFALVDANSEDVAAVCAGLEGLPLAIELAAARVDHLSPHQIRDALHSRLTLLTGGARDLPARQRTLGAAIEWSYELLGEGQQKLFRRLAVFVGGRTTEAVEAVCVGDDRRQTTDDVTSVVPSVDTIHALESLVDKSLLREESVVGYTPSEARYMMLEMIREYALEQLEENGESNLIRERHADYFLRLAEEGDAHLRGPKQLAWLNRLEIEHDNIRAALRWALERNAIDIGLRLVGALRMFWTQHSHFTEGLQWAKAILAMPGAEAHTATRAKALWSAGGVAWIQGDYEARPLLEESVEIWREVGDKRGLAYSVQHLGMEMLQEGQPEVARPLVAESVALFREIGHRLGLILSLASLWMITIAQDDPGAQSSPARRKEQRALLEESIQVARELGDNWGMALALRNLAWADIREGNYAAARPRLNESLALQGEVGAKHEVAPILADLAELAQLEGNYEEAMELYQRSLDLYKDYADKRGVVIIMAGIGGVALLMGDIQNAREVLSEALQLAKELGGVRHSMAVLEVTGCLEAALGQPARAAVLLSAAQARYRPFAFSRPASARVEFNSYLESARAQLDEVAWRQAWAQGEAMSLEEALQFASESLDGRWTMDDGR